MRDLKLGLFYSLSTMEDDVKLKVIVPILILGFPIILGTVLKICYLIYKRFHHNFEPVHVFWLNYFGTLAIYIFSDPIAVLLMIFPASETVCWQYLFLSFT